MKILYFDFSIPYLIKDADHPVGGAAVEWMNWIKGFQKNKDEVGVLTWKGAKQLLGDKADQFNMVETFGQDEGIRYLRTFNLRLPRFKAAIKNYQPDVVIQGCAALNTGLLSIAASGMNVPFVYRAANDMDADDRYKTRMSAFEAFFYQLGLKKSTAIVCQNEYQFENFKKKFPNKPMTILHNPYEALEAVTPKPVGERKYIAWLGVFQPQKNMTALLEVVKALPNHQFRIGGKASNTSMDDATRLALKALEEASNVTFEGYVKRTQIASFLSDAHLLLNTSHYEGFSNTFLEAFAVGTPIVCPRKVDPDHIIENNRLGMVAEDYDGLPVCIDQVINDQDYSEMANRCQQYVVQKHDPKKLAAEFVNFLASL